MLLSYQAANEVFARTTEIIGDMVGQYAELDKALTEFKKVSDLTGSSLDKYVGQLSQMGKITARTGSEMVEAATQFRKNGFNDEDSAQLAVVATMYQNVSDTAITAADSASFIISQMKAFRMEASDATKIIDAVNEVAANFAVGTNDLSSALEVAGAGLSTYKNSYEETIALITAGSEIMTGRSLQVARGLNTIAARLVKNQGTLAEYGIALNNADGTMRSTFDILSDLSVAWEKMGDEERVSVGNTIAGINQYKVLAAVMENFQSAIDANQVALEAQGSAVRQNEAYMESFEAKTNMLKASFQELSNKVINGDLVDGALAVLNGALSFLNTGIGTAITQVVLFGGALGALAMKISAMKIIGTIVGQFTTLIAAIDAATISGGAFGATIAANGGIMGVAIPAAFGLVAGVIALGAAFKYVYDETKKFSLEGMQEELAETTTELEAKEAELAEYESHINELTDAEKAYVETLKEEIALLKEKKGAQEEGIKKAQIAALESSVYGMRGTGKYYEDGGEEYEKYNKATYAYNELLAAYAKGEGYTQNQKQSLKSYIDTYDPLIKQFQEAGMSIDDINNKYDGLATKVKIVKNEYDRVTGTIKKTTGTWLEEGKVVDTIGSAIENSSAAIAQYREATSVDYGGVFKSYQQIASDIQSRIDAGTADAYTIRAAMDLYLPPETVKEIGGDVQRGAAELSKLFSSQFGKVLTSEDPMGTFKTMLRSSGNEIKTDSGEVAARISADGKIQIASFDLLAQAFHTTREAAEAFFSFLQSQTGTIMHTDEEVSQLKDALMPLMADAEMGNRNPIEAMAQGISQIMNTTDPAEIKELMDAIFISDGLEPPKIETDEIQGYVDKLQAANEAVASLQDKEITTDFTGLDDLDNFVAQWTAVKDGEKKSVSFEVVDEGGTAVSAYNHWVGLPNGESKENTFTEKHYIYRYEHTEKFAKGTKSAKGGTALVNDGSPVNNSQAELIVQDGKAFIANGGETGTVDLKRGATVYTAAETQAILRKKGLKEEDFYGGGIASFANGTDGRKPISALSDGYYADYPETIDYASELFDYMGYSDADIAKKREAVKRKSDKDRQKIVEKLYKDLKHYREMDVIDEEEYYRTLYVLNETYYKDRKGLQEDYWKYQEEIYKYEAEALNNIIEKQEKLNNLAKVKTQKVLVYRNGMYQYVQNAEAISKAQRDVYGYASGTTSASGGLSLVGENGPELRVLGQGDGIIPTDITKNLMRIGSTPLGSLGDSAGDIYNFNISTVKLENVNNVNDIFEGLKNLAIQRTAMKT